MGIDDLNSLVGDFVLEEIQDEEDDRFPYGRNECPLCRCMTLEINPEDEYDITCSHCGFEG